MVNVTYKSRLIHYQLKTQSQTSSIHLPSVRFKTSSNSQPAPPAFRNNLCWCIGIRFPVFLF